MQEVTPIQPADVGDSAEDSVEVQRRRCKDGESGTGEKSRYRERATDRERVQTGREQQTGEGKRNMVRLVGWSCKNVQISF